MISATNALFQQVNMTKHTVQNNSKKRTVGVTFLKKKTIKSNELKPTHFIINEPKNPNDKQWVKERKENRN